MKVVIETAEEAVEVLRSCLSCFKADAEDAGHDLVSCACRCCSSYRLIQQGYDLFQLSKAERILDNMSEKLKQKGDSSNQMGF